MNQNPAVRPPGREHIPNYPTGFIALRILQFVFSVILLGLVGYSVSLVPFVSSIIMMYTTLVTFIVTLWQIIAHFWSPQAYNYWAVLAFDIKLVIFWLISFAFVAATAALYWATGSYSYYYDYYYADTVFGGVLAATAGLGALEFLFFKISLIIHSIMVCRHRRTGGHNKPVPVGGVQPVAVPVQVAPGGFQPQQQAYGMQPMQPIYQAPPGFQQQQQQQPIPEKQQIPPVVTPSPPPNQPQMFHQPQPIAPVQQFPQGQFQQPPQGQFQQPPQGYAEMYSPHHHQPPPFPNQAPPQ